MRVFMAIDLPPSLKRLLADFQTEIKNLGVKGSYKTQDNFHITLEFLGEIDLSAKPVLMEILSFVARQYRPFLLDIGGIGAFPSFRRPHTLWTDVDGNLNSLSNLRDELHCALESRGFVLEKRPFKPHLTIVSHPRLGCVDLSSFCAKKLGAFLVTEIMLFESKQVEGRRHYEALHTAGLAAENRWS